MAAFSFVKMMIITLCFIAIQAITNTLMHVWEQYPQTWLTKLKHVSNHFKFRLEMRETSGLMLNKLEAIKKRLGRCQTKSL